MDVTMAFVRFEEAILAAGEDRGSTEKKQVMASALQSLLEAAGKSRRDLIITGIADRATVDRWLRGHNTPQAHQIGRLKQFLFPRQSESVPDYSEVARALTNARYRPVIQFMLEHEITEDQAGVLFRIASESKGILTPEMIRLFLGL